MCLLYETVPAKIVHTKVSDSGIRLIVTELLTTTDDKYTTVSDECGVYRFSGE